MIDTPHAVQRDFTNIAEQLMEANTEPQIQYLQLCWCLNESTSVRRQTVRTVASWHLRHYATGHFGVQRKT